jgi:hypothetical protein
MERQHIYFRRHTNAALISLKSQSDINELGDRGCAEKFATLFCWQKRMTGKKLILLKKFFLNSSKNC